MVEVVVRRRVLLVVEGPVALDKYLQQTQRLIKDQQERLINIEDLVTYTNKSRIEVAMRSQSLRILSPVAGSITHFEIEDPGRGYVDPEVIVTPPDAPTGEQPHPGGLRARASATVADGHITAVTVVEAGNGYFMPEVHVRDLH